MLLEFGTCLLLFLALAFGPAWPLAARLALDPAEKLGASVLLSLLAVYLVAFAIYVLGLPAATFWALPALAVAGLAAGRPALAATARDAEARALLAGQLLVTGWCAGWLWFVASYSGGGWAGDWFEHWERTQFFLDHWPLDTKFLGFGALPARPPLANLITGALLAVTRKDFAHYQFFTTLLNSLAFLPATLLARRFHQRLGGSPAGGRAAMAGLALLLMLNPSFVQNATFAWTKLIAVGLVLGGLYFFLRARDAAAPPAAAPLAATGLALGLLAHYSAGPYVILLAGAWFGFNRARWGHAAFWRQTAQLVLVGGLILATWFGWSLAAYGAHTTFFSNSSVAVKDAQSGNQLLKVALNLRDTLVPHFLRPVDPALLAQRNPWSYARDWFFQLYQVNLLFIFGSVAGVAMAAALWGGRRAAAPQTVVFWAGLAGGAVLLGVAAHGARDHWGVAHVCLQPLVVLGLAYLAARWPGLGRGWRRALLAGAAVDFGLGIALQFAAQSQTPDLAIALGRAPAGAMPFFNDYAVMNLAGKLVHGLAYFHDALPLPAPVVPVLLAGLLLLALARVRAAAK
jgi:hypothetical protein